IDKEFVKKIELALQGELETNNLRQEELTAYCENWRSYHFFHKKSDSGKAEGAERGKKEGIKPYQAIKYARDYLNIIQLAAANKKLTETSLEDIDKQLSSEENGPKLTPAELNEPNRTQNIYDNYGNYREIITNLTIDFLAEEKKTKSRKLKDKLDKFIERVKDRITD
ncbi:17239_t:CDS:2, partial [Racocetra persica]